MDGGQIKDVLKGNILFIKFDNYGDWFGLSKKDINYVKFFMSLMLKILKFSIIKTLLSRIWKRAFDVHTY